MVEGYYYFVASMTICMIDNISRAAEEEEGRQVKFLLSTQIQNSPPLVPGAGSLRRRQNLNHPGAR